MILQPRHLDLRARQVEVGGDDKKVVDAGRQHLLGQLGFADQRAVQAQALGAFQTERAGGVGLRVEVNEQNTPAQLRQTRRQADRRGGFTHPALLVGDGDELHVHGTRLPGAKR